MRAALGRPPVVVGAIVLVSAALAASFSLQITGYEPDELGYTRLAIGIAHALTPFTTSYGGASRLNQLYPLLIAPLWGLFGNVTAFQLTHAWNALLMASAAIPVYLLAREVVHVRWACYLAAAVAAVMPWMTLSTAELTEVAAYPAAVWALLAMQRSLVTPSVRRDIIALIAIGIASYGRLQLILFATVFVLAVFGHELGYAWTQRGRTTHPVRAAGRRLLREHAVLSGVAALGLILGVPLLLTGELASAFGFYGNTLSGVDLGGATFDLARSFLTGIVLGLGAVPAALAFGFVGSALARPVSRGAHAFATLTLISVVALTLQVAEVSVRFNGAVVQERYLFYIAPLLVVAMFAAMLGTRRPVPTVLAGTVVVTLLIVTTDYKLTGGAFWYQVSPGFTSFYEWVLPAFNLGPAAGALVPAGLVAGGLGVLVAALVAVLGGRCVVTAVAVLVIAFCVAETTHALQRVVSGIPGSLGLGGGTVHGQDWVDGAVGNDADVTQLLDDTGGLAAASQLWNDNAFWNRAVASASTTQPLPLKSYLPTSELELNSASGALGVAGALPETVTSEPPAPRYLVVDARGYPVLPVGTVARHSPGGTLELLRVTPPLRAAYALSGVSPDGWMLLDRPAVLRLYSLRGTGGCAVVEVVLSLRHAVPADEILTVSGVGATRRTTLTPGAGVSIDRRVCAVGTGVPELRLAVTEPAAAAETLVTPQVLDVRVGPA